MATCGTKRGWNFRVSETLVESSKIYIKQNALAKNRRKHPNQSTEKNSMRVHVIGAKRGKTQVQQVLTSLPVSCEINERVNVCTFFSSEKKGFKFEAVASIAEAKNVYCC